MMIVSIPQDKLLKIKFRLALTPRSLVLNRNILGRWYCPSGWPDIHHVSISLNTVVGFRSGPEDTSSSSNYITSLWSDLLASDGNWDSPPAKFQRKSAKRHVFKFQRLCFLTKRRDHFRRFLRLDRLYSRRAYVWLKSVKAVWIIWSFLRPD
jgi:hypothetical protein